jgi:hypothetical protein
MGGGRASEEVKGEGEESGGCSSRATKIARVVRGGERGSGARRAREGERETWWGEDAEHLVCGRVAGRGGEHWANVDMMEDIGA